MHLSLTNYPEGSPIIIAEDAYKLYGIIREATGATKMIILAPWVMGDRTGVTRIYVEIARALQKKSISSFCVDIPPVNYSHDPEFNSTYYPEFYAKYLEKAFLTMTEKYPELEIILIGYCSSAIPAIYIARKYNLKKVVTMNPWDFSDNYVKKTVHESFIDYIKYYPNKIHMLHIISEREDNYLSKLDYVKRYFQDENCMASVELINGATHTFDGWMIKKSVIEKLLNWINTDR